jgi:hypothetical protein
MGDIEGYGQDTLHTQATAVEILASLSAGFYF